MLRFPGEWAARSLGHPRYRGRTAGEARRRPPGYPDARREYARHAFRPGFGDRGPGACGWSPLHRLPHDQGSGARGDPAARERLASVPDISGIYYEDDESVEGYTSPEDQRRTYETLKEIFPGALVLHPTRLDPIAFDPGYLDAVYRPDYTDAVTPYFYPVGTTILGTAAEADSWQPRLESLLSEIARRTPGDVPVLPVLQAFEQDGFPVDAAFLARQFEVYARVWPGNENAAAFWWGDSAQDAPLVGFAFRPRVWEGVRTLFRRLARHECGRPADPGSGRVARPAVP